MKREGRLDNPSKAERIGIELSLIVCYIARVNTPDGTMDDRLRLCSDFAPPVESLVREVVKESGLSVHSINSRVKTKPSLERKLSKRRGSRADLASVTDVLGIRITTYFSDDVDTVAEVIRNEFSIDEANSIDRRRAGEPDRFGYSSLHFVVNLAQERASWTEYKRFADEPFEIQIRSILQHTWAEIEHDLGYKTETAIPREVRRKFAQLAGLLEIADEQFAAIRSELAEYRISTASDIDQGKRNLPLDLDTLRAWISQDYDISEFNALLARLLQMGDNIDDEFEPGVLDHLAVLGFDTLDEVVDYFQSQRNLLERFSKHWIDDDYPLGNTEARDASDATIDASIGVFYICLLRSAQVLAKGQDHPVKAFLESRFQSPPVVEQLLSCLEHTVRQIPD